MGINGRSGLPVLPPQHPIPSWYVVRERVPFCNPYWPPGHNNPLLPYLPCASCPALRPNPTYCILRLIPSACASCGNKDSKTVSFCYLTIVTPCYGWVSRNNNVAIKTNKNKGLVYMLCGYELNEKIFRINIPPLCAIYRTKGWAKISSQETGVQRKVCNG